MPYPQEKIKAELKAERARLHKLRLEQQGLPEGHGTSQKKMTKQERRELQEAQRLAKINGQPLKKSDSKSIHLEDKHKIQMQLGVSPKDSSSPLIAQIANMAITSSSSSTNPLSTSGLTPGITGGTGALNQRITEKALEAAMIQEKKVRMFEHLEEPNSRSFSGPPSDKWRGSSLTSISEGTECEKPVPSTKKPIPVHPAVKSAGLKMACFEIDGANERAAAMLKAFAIAINDYKTPPQQTMARHLQTYLNPQISYFVQQRPLTIGMGNAIRWLKEKISLVDIDKDEASTKRELISLIASYIQERIHAAIESVAEYGASKIKDGDVILIYGHSSSVLKMLIRAFKEDKVKFNVIVIDSRIGFWGQKTVRQLVAAGMARKPMEIGELVPSSIHNTDPVGHTNSSGSQAQNICGNVSYAYITSLGYVMKQASKVILGVEAIMGNGALLSRSGTSMVALAAHNYRVPVLVSCESYKFTDRVQLDSVVSNELGNPENLIWTPSESKQNWISPNKHSKSLVSNTMMAINYSPLASDRFGAWPSLNNTRTFVDLASQSKTLLPHPSTNFPNLNLLSKSKAINNMIATSAIGSTTIKHTKPQDKSTILDPIDKQEALKKWDLLEQENPLAKWREQPSLKILDITRDITPSKFVSVIITELGLIPTTSIPVVLREYKN
ncbi:hypothetical protein BB559_001990 [Furculomyces boomerangus]|uniref:Translation initiation factor eIF2B subunit delta n=1 Tax=Furculomyces boomerangus TaxID=61424 RepID=A0A2T9YZ79_9FUNG|nr:hypothetical protein BB559_001990 [Furculomyces boomerangus]